MKRIIVIVIVIVILPAGYWLISPLFITKKVDEKLTDITPAMNVSETSTTTAPASEFTVVGEGRFTGLFGHSAAGTAKLLKMEEKYYVRFEDDFRVTNGPDLFVYFGKDGVYVAEARVAALKGNEGGQNYEVPKTINPADFNEIWVWCRAFSVPFGKAELK